MSKAVGEFQYQPPIIKFKDLISNDGIVVFGDTMLERKTRPATEEDLIVPNDNHPMQPGDGTPFVFRSVLVDGQPAKAGIGSLGGYSERIAIGFEKPHSDFGKEFATKHFQIPRDEPGRCYWGHDNQSFTIEVFVDDD